MPATEKFPLLGDYNGNFVHPRIAVGGCMRAHFVPDLVKAGIRGIVNATGVAQKSHLIYIASLPDSIHWQLLGYWDGQHPTDKRDSVVDCVDPQFAFMMVELTARVVRDCSPVLIHCGGGIGRSGNLAAIVYAAMENVTPQEAVKRMRLLRPKLGDFGGEKWKYCDVPKLVALAKQILAEPQGSSKINMMP